ncbi:MAG: methyl-accepting chemotaxis protein [Turicibacter sp.]|nr:methyl-accepting chemotaxis protein [Turicibacter sp.]
MKILTRLNISTKLILSYVLIISLFLGVIVFSNFAYSRNEEAHSHLYDFVIMRMLYTLEYQQLLAEMQGYLQANFLNAFWPIRLGGERQLTLASEEYLIFLHESLQEISQIYIASVEIDPVFSDAERAFKITTMTNVVQNTSVVFNQFQTHFFFYGSRLFTADSVMDLIPIIEGDLQVLREAAEDKMLAMRLETQQNLVGIETVNFVVSAIAVAFAALLAFLIIMNFRTKVSNLLKSAILLQKGDFKVDLRTNDTDEMGNISNTIANMVDRFKAIISQINYMSEEFKRGDIDARIVEDDFEGDYRVTAQAINSLNSDIITEVLAILNTTKSYADGNFKMEPIQLPGKKAMATDTLNSIRTTLESLYNDMHDLANAGIQGDLTARVDLDRYSGDWKIAMEALNHFVSNVAKPIDETLDILKQFALGNLKERIEGDYNGIFLEMSKSVNRTMNAISAYVEDINRVLDSMSERNLDVSIDRIYVGDFEHIKTSITKIIDTFNGILQEIQDSSISIDSGAHSIAESSQDLSVVATEQSEAVDEIEHTVELILNQVKTNVEKANSTKDVAENAKDSAYKGNADMQEMLDSMSEISKASNDISKVIKVIDDIAFQTNLLSLNASVEAARAGEHGKGFAVVAEEVRTLATRSKDAAQETAILIESSVSKSKQGSLIANKTAETLNAIVGQISEISDLVNDVASSSEDQMHAIENVREAMKEISIATQVVSSNSQDTASTSEELSSQSETFKDMVGKFNLRGR